MTKEKIKSIKHYTNLERIGSGGMGEVFKANDTLLERNVAIKLMHPHLSQDKQNVNRLMREARAAAKLVHPNVVTIHEIGEADIGHYIVMEYVRGVPLSDFIYNNESLEPERCLQLTLQILKAMQVAHREGVLHRDIKFDQFGLGKPFDREF